MTKLMEIGGTWFMCEGGQEVALNPQPTLGDLRFNGLYHELHMGYPHGHDVPVFNEHGYWRGDEYAALFSSRQP